MELVAACELNGGIGYQNKLPWGTLKEDLSRFYKLTTTKPPELINVVIMGRKTWDSLPHKPLKNRLNVVLSKNGIKSYPENVKVFNSKTALLKYLLEINKGIHKIFVIGGQEIYNMFYKTVTKIHLTMIKDFYKCDKFINLKYINEHFNITQKIDKPNMSFITMDLRTTITKN